ncbi:MAG: M20/M25/M40 family metallo-hydrolase [Clostridiales bacterium]|nr:M20/M25/M40 family metallo-hydrolase [Clostridiales bacterium]
MVYLFIGIGVLIVIIVVMVIRTILFSNNEQYIEIIQSNSIINKDEVVKKLQEAIKIKTISNSDTSKTNYQEFEKFIIYLKNAFPLIHKHMNLSIINKYSLLYHWKGKDQLKKPGLIMAHIDVVPIEEGTENDWDVPPFEGKIKDGFVYGRGTMDIKIQIITAMQACENLIKQGVVPERDIYLSFGHDEEIGGQEGALKIVEYLKKEKITFEFVLDEGGAINTGAISSVKKAVAFVGIAEKGYSNLEVKIKAEGGHASTPPTNTSLGLVSKAICKIEKRKMKKRFPLVTRNMILALGKEMNFINQFIIANLWITKPLFMKAFAKPGTNGEALLRTTIAPTMAKASMEPNVLPQCASFTVNCRILHGDNGNKLIKYISNQCKGMDYKINILRMDEPSKVSDPNSEFYKMLSGVIKGLHDNTAVVPYLMVAGTDCRKYECISKNVYRFTPFHIPLEDMKRIHGTNERISEENIINCVRFFETLVKKC